MSGGSSSRIITLGLLATLSLPAWQMTPLLSPAGSQSRQQPTVRTLAFAGSSTFDVRQLPQLPPLPRGPHRDMLAERAAPRTRLLGTEAPAPVGSGISGGALAPAPSTSTSFEGLHYSQTCDGGQCGNGHPPDPNGDVGPVYYIETINVAVGVYDKTDGSLVASFTFDSFMSQGTFGNLCDTDNFGDPVVVYDSVRDRWVITDFAFQLDGSGNVVNPPGAYQCFAVSQTGDPVSGGWNFYSLHLTDGLGDYPKLGVWSDGLYMSANMYDFAASGSYQNVRVWAFDLVAMEAGSANPASVSFNARQRNGPCLIFSLLPANARAPAGLPPAGRPNYFASVWCYTGIVRVWAFHVDWNNPANSTFTGPTDASTGSNWALPPSTVPSKGGNDLDTLPMRLMAQNQYSNIGSIESIWTSHTVQGSSSGQSAVRWYQVPVTGGTIGSALQASTWNPDTANRFMPSLAVDRLGDVAVGYSVSSASLYPAIRYAGRLAGDPAGTFGQTEQSLIEGGGSQTGTCGPSACERWGDYSAMTLDPDGCTFWYVNEYYPTSGLDHHTRIGAFRYAACVPLQPSLHIADLDAAARRAGLLGWRAVVTLRVRDASGLPVSFATVTASWSGGASAASSCTTDQTGDCYVGSPVVPNAAASVTLTVSGASHATLPYDAAQNTDPEADSNGTSITVPRP